MSQDPAGLEGSLGVTAQQAQQRFCEELDEFRIAYGAPSVASLATTKTLGMSKGNLSAIFNGQRLPSLEVTVRLVRTIAKDAPAEEREKAEQHWRSQWRAVQSAKAAADRAARRSRAADARSAADLLDETRAQAGEIIVQAEAQAEQLVLEAQARAQSEAARLTAKALEGDAAATALAHAQDTCDQLLARANREAEEIVEQARLRAVAVAAGLTGERLDAIDSAGQIKGTVEHCVPDGVVLRVVDPGSLNGVGIYVHTGPEIAARMAPGRHITASISPLLSRPVLVGRFEQVLPSGSVPPKAPAPTGAPASDTPAVVGPRQGESHGTAPESVSPIARFTTIYKVGQIVPTTVTKQIPDGAMVWLPDGAESVLLNSRLPEHQQALARTFSVGDEVFAKITRIDPDLQVVYLSVEEANEGLTGDPSTDRFDPTLYGMTAEFDAEGNFVFPEGFDPESGEWLEGSDAAREAWEAHYTAAQALFEKHEEQVKQAREGAHSS